MVLLRILDVPMSNILYRLKLCLSYDITKININYLQNITKFYQFSVLLNEV